MIELWAAWLLSSAVATNVAIGIVHTNAGDAAALVCKLWSDGRAALPLTSHSLPALSCCKVQKFVCPRTVSSMVESYMKSGRELIVFLFIFFIPFPVLLLFFILFFYNYPKLGFFTTYFFYGTSRFLFRKLLMYDSAGCISNSVGRRRH